jgi:hypothetical protein
MGGAVMDYVIIIATITVGTAIPIILLIYIWVGFKSYICTCKNPAIEPVVAGGFSYFSECGHVEYMVGKRTMHFCKKCDKQLYLRAGK